MKREEKKNKEKLRQQQKEKTDKRGERVICCCCGFESLWQKLISFVGVEGYVRVQVGALRLVEGDCLECLVVKFTSFEGLFLSYSD